jgi:hypothetical protein
VGHHGADFCNFNDRWSQIVNLQSDQDGSAYLIDWYDQQQCHLPAPEKHDRSNGRIFKITYQNQRASKVNLATLDDAALGRLLLQTNSWHARHASRLLQEHAALNHGLNAEVRGKLLDMLHLDNAQGASGTGKSPNTSSTQPGGSSVGERRDETSRLRALWSLHNCGALEEPTSLRLLHHGSEYLRAWTIQLATEDRQVGQELRDEFARLAADDPSPVVRLYLAAALQRLPVEQRGAILEKLVAHENDAKDQNLPLMYWYAAEPLVAKNPTAALALLEKGKIPILREYIARRMAASAQ